MRFQLGQIANNILTKSRQSIALRFARDAKALSSIWRHERAEQQIKTALRFGSDLPVIQRISAEINRSKLINHD